MPSSYISFPCHAVFSTKRWRPLLSEEIAPRVYAFIGGILRTEGGTLIAAGGMPDHIHLLMFLPKERSIPDTMRIIKSTSSRWIHEAFPALQRFAWQPGYGAFAVSKSRLGVVQRYIARQKEHHRRVTFHDEFIWLLRVHEIPFDERYLWKD